MSPKPLVTGSLLVWNATNASKPSQYDCITKNTSLEACLLLITRTCRNTLSSVIVLALVADRGRIRCEICIFNNRDTPCRMGLAVGAIGFAVGLFLLVVDVFILVADEVFEERTSIKPWCQRAIESAISFAVTVLWIVSFAVLFREWNERNFSLRRAMQQDGFRRDIDGEAILAFSFISFSLWLFLCIMAVVRWCNTAFPEKTEEDAERQTNNTGTSPAAPQLNSWEVEDTFENGNQHGTGAGPTAYGNHMYM